MNQIDDTLNIDTPENVTFGYEIAGIGSRFLAALIDTLIVGVLQVIIAILVLLLIRQTSGGELDLNSLGSSLTAWAAAIAGFISLCFYWGYYIFFEMLWNGKSPGKKAIRLRVIRVDGTPITITEALIRNLVRLVDFLPAFYGLGVIVTFVNPQTRRLGDLAAGTVVVRDADPRQQLKNLAALEKQAARPPAAPSRPDDDNQPPETAAGLAAAYPVERLSYQDIQMIEMYFQRQKELTNRLALAGQISTRMWAKLKFDGPAPLGAAAEAALLKILKDYQQTL